MPTPAEPTCPRCQRPIAADDMVEFDSTAVAHVDCRRPRGLTHQERGLLYGYCWAHPVMCPTCSHHLQLFELTADPLEPHKRTICPRCQTELIETIRQHLYTCSQPPEVVRHRAREARETARKLVKQAHQQLDRADLLMQEAEVTMTQLRDTMKQSALEAISRLVQAKLRDGRLPRREIQDPIPGRSGDGSSCGACDQRITDRHLMKRLPGPPPLPLHAVCFLLWREERRAFTPSD